MNRSPLKVLQESRQCQAYLLAFLISCGAVALSELLQYKPFALEGLFVFILIVMAPALLGHLPKWNDLSIPEKALKILLLLWAAWYALPYLAFCIDVKSLSDMALYDEKLFVKAGYLTAMLYNGFGFGCYLAVKTTRNSRVLRHRTGQLSTAGEIAFVMLFVVVLYLSIIYKPAFNISEFVQYLDTFDDEYAVPSNRWMSIAFVSLMLGSMAFRQYILTRRKIYLILPIVALLGNGYIGAEIGRRQIVWHGLGLLLFPFCLWVRRPLVWLSLILVPVVIYLTIALSLRGSGTEQTGMDPIELLTSPISELSLTASYHARLIEYTQKYGFFWGTTYFEHAVQIIPFSSKVLKHYNIVDSTDPYYRLVAIETVNWARLYFFTFGSSIISECYANFGMLGSVFSILLGFGFSKILCYLSRYADSPFGYLTVCIFVAMFMWGVRCSLADLYYHSRYILIAAILAFLFSFLNKKTLNEMRSEVLDRQRKGVDMVSQKNF